MSDPLLVARITINRLLTDDDDYVTFDAEDHAGNDLPLIEALGLLRLAEDTAIRQAMGEDEDEDE